MTYLSQYIRNLGGALLVLAAFACAIGVFLGVKVLTVAAFGAVAGSVAAYGALLLLVVAATTWIDRRFPSAGEND